MSNEEKKEGAFRGIGRAVKEMAPYSGLGLQLAITVVIFWFIGKLIDDFMNSTLANLKSGYEISNHTTTTATKAYIKNLLTSIFIMLFLPF